MEQKHIENTEQVHEQAQDLKIIADENTALIPHSSDRPKRTCKNATLGVLTVGDSLLVGAALGYGVYAVIAYEVRGRWGYAFLGIFGLVESGIELTRILSRAPEAQKNTIMRNYEAGRDSFGNSLASMSLISLGVSDNTANFASTCALVPVLTTGQILTRYVARRHELRLHSGGESDHERRCAEFNHVLRGIFAAIHGAGLATNAISVFEGFDVEVPLAAKIVCPIITGVLNTPAHYGYSTAAKIVRHGVSSLNNGFFLITILLDIIEDAMESDLSGGWRLAVPICGAVLIAALISAKRYIRDVSPVDEQEELRLYTPEDNAEAEINADLFDHPDLRTQFSLNAEM